MKKPVLLLLVICLLAANAALFAAGNVETDRSATGIANSGKTAAAAGKVVQILETYTGMAIFDVDPLADNSASQTAVDAPAPIIIRTREQYENFIETRIPEYEMTPKEPAPESNDPLLKKPSIDFSKNMMIVIFSLDPNRFIDLKISGVSVQNNTMTVKTEIERSDPNG